MDMIAELKKRQMVKEPLIYEGKDGAIEDIISGEMIQVQMISGEQPGVPTSQTQGWGLQGLSQELEDHQAASQGPNLPASTFTSHMAKLPSAPSPVSYLFLLFCFFLLSPPAPPRCLWTTLLSSQNCSFHGPDGQTLVPALLRRELQRGESSVGNVGQRGRRGRAGAAGLLPLPGPGVWPDLPHAEPSPGGPRVEPRCRAGLREPTAGVPQAESSQLLLLPGLS